MSFYSTNKDRDVAGKIIGNTYAAESNTGFKADIQNMIEKYALENVNIINDFDRILAREDTRSDFMDRCLESVTNTAALHDSSMSTDNFYNNYSERLGQLIENSCNQIAREAVMTGYAPIVSYAPFFIKKQWVSCVWKDVLMSEVTTSPILNYKFEKRYLKDQDGNRYDIPEVYYDKAKMAKLYGEATGNDLDSSKALTLPVNHVSLLPTELDPDGYIVDGRNMHYSDKANVLTQDIAICAIHIVDGEHSIDTWIPMNIRINITTHNFVKGSFKYVAKDEDGKPILSDSKPVVIEGEIVGNVDFDNAAVTAFSTNAKVTGIKLAGKTANRFNHRSLDVERRVEQLQYIMPESGPRLNSAVTVEEAADAIALGRIDMFADNVDMMGDALAQLNDFSMRSFVQDSFETQKAAGQGPHGYVYGPDGTDTSLIEEGGFSAMPYGGYSQNISTWMADSKEYFERFLENLKLKLKTPEVTVVCVCHPTLVRYLRADGAVKWIFSDQTDVSGLKINYNLGITTVNGDRVHIISCQYLAPSDGIQTILIPTTSELITFKNVFYSVIVDRGYRNPLEQLVPNIMSTQRTLTFEVLPVQGRFYIDGREANPPKALFSQDNPLHVSNTVVTDASAPGVGG